jgi:hypothetical protein
VPLAPKGGRTAQLGTGMDGRAEKQGIHQLKPCISGPSEHMVVGGLTKLD